MLTNIASPDLRIKENCIETIKKAENKKNSLLPETLEDVQTYRLKSRKPLWKTAKNLTRSKFETSRR